MGAQCKSCLKPDCEQCSEGIENHCTNDFVQTYGAKYQNGDTAQGGYAKYWRGNSHFVFHIPDAIPSEMAAPMLCGGVTTYSPLKQNGCGPGKKVGVIGIGGKFLSFPPFFSHLNKHTKKNIHQQSLTPLFPSPPQVSATSVSSGPKPSAQTKSSPSPAHAPKNPTPANSAPTTSSPRAKTAGSKNTPTPSTSSSVPSPRPKCLWKVISLYSLSKDDIFNSECRKILCRILVRLRWS